MAEEWKNMEKLGFSKYSCSNLGRIRNDLTRQILVLKRHEHGYLCISLRHDDVPSKNCYVHLLVYETFIGVIPKGYQVDHINQIKDDSRLENLRAVTKEANIANRTLPAQIKGRKVVQLDFDLNFINEFLAIRYALDQLDITTNMCSNSNSIKAACEKSREAIANGNLEYGEFKNYYWLYSEDYYPAPEGETWKELDVLGIQMMISDYGRVKYPNGEITYGKSEAENNAEGGYMVAIIKRKNHRVHRLVMMAFNPIDNNDDMIVDHINSNRSDNRLVNLRWATQNENSRYAQAVAVIRYQLMNEQEIIIKNYETFRDAYTELGYNHRAIEKFCDTNQSDNEGYYWRRTDPNITKRKPKKGRGIQRFDWNNNLLETYVSLREASEKSGMTQDMIADVCKGFTKNVTHHKYVFKYEDAPEMSTYDKYYKTNKKADKNPDFTADDLEDIDDPESIDDLLARCSKRTLIPLTDDNIIVPQPIIVSDPFIAVNDMLCFNDLDFDINMYENIDKHMLIDGMLCVNDLDNDLVDNANGDLNNIEEPIQINTTNHNYEVPDNIYVSLDDLNLDEQS